jgi:hypothetical protein
MFSVNILKRMSYALNKQTYRNRPGARTDPISVPHSRGVVKRIPGTFGHYNRAG